ncbi:Retrovirus-related Pol polyprotein LINE-1 [Gossypium australe]|uniref:Retrovirus-related Pol polyprotein LINE-1 n=1 Tax=Gossypium australe TaxID=47621 RepID=A0A5B6V3D7_9ROSI|nr:Retrovirus-related Pol polyprotein LINE-1 [Gossypium australe]
MARISWDTVCKPKVKGGAGVANLGVKNKALLAKWSWRFVIEKEALWRKVILAKYESNVQQWRFKATYQKDMSAVWRGIVENAKDAEVSKWVRSESFFWKIGNGKSTLFWWDIWCGNRPLKVLFPRLFRLAKNKVSTVVDSLNYSGNGSVNWGDWFSRPLLDRENEMCKDMANKVSGTVLLSEVEDRLYWINDKFGVFLVKKCPDLLILDDEADVNFACSEVWNIKVPPRVRSFLWMLAIDRIPSKEFFIKRGVNIQNFSINCLWCEGKPESASHMFFKCRFIEDFWAKIFNWWDAVWKKVDGFVEFFALCKNVKIAASKKCLWLISIATACWTIWLVRNGLVFDGRRVHMENLVFQTKIRELLWIRSVHNEIML